MSRRYRSTTVSVDIDISDVLYELSEDDLRDELRRRKLGVPFEGIGSDWFDRLKYFLNRGQVFQALAMIEGEEVRALVSDEAREAQYNQATLMGSAGAVH